MTDKCFCCGGTNAHSRNIKYLDKSICETCMFGNDPAYLTKAYIEDLPTFNGDVYHDENMFREPIGASIHVHYDVSKIVKSHSAYKFIVLDEVVDKSED